MVLAVFIKMVFELLPFICRPLFDLLLRLRVRSFIWKWNHARLIALRIEVVEVEHIVLV